MQSRMFPSWMGKRCFLPLASTLLLSSMLLSSMVLSSMVLCGLAGERGGMPPQSNAFGKSLSEWFALYWDWVLWSQVGVEKPDQVGQVKFLPIPVGESNGGAGSVEDPLILVGHLDVTLKPGTAFVLPVACWAGWTYEPESGIPDDLPLVESAFYGTVLVDGRPITSGYVAPVYYDPSISLPSEYYPRSRRPTSKGSPLCIHRCRWVPTPSR